MKLIHISDVHIHDETLLGVHSSERFLKMIAHIEKFHMDADKIVITGDLTHKGEAQTYVEFREILLASKLKARLQPALLIGNHDNRETFQQHFPDVPRDENDFVQYCEKTDEGLFVYMDSMEQGVSTGRYCEKRCAWLTNVLEGARTDNLAVYLFMHHNPAKVHVANADQFNFIEPDETALQQILRNNNDIIRHIFFGHCHYTLSGAACGIPFSAPCSSHPCWPEFSGDKDRMGFGPLEPEYNVCFLEGENTIIHTIKFLQEENMRWVVKTETGWAEEIKNPESH